MLRGKVPHLSSLLVDNIASIVEVSINELAVLNVHEGHKEDDRSRDQGDTPLGNELDEEIGDKSRGEGLWELSASCA